MKPESLTAILRPYRQNAIAAAVGVSDETAANWYHGRTIPRDEHLPKLALFLRLTLDEIAEVVVNARVRQVLNRAVGGPA